MKKGDLKILCLLFQLFIGQSFAFVLRQPCKYPTTRPDANTNHKLTTSLNVIDFSAASEVIDSSTTMITTMDQDTAEALAGPFFGASLFPYLAFLYFLSRDENECPKGVTVGFATCLLFVFLTIPAAIAAKLLYGVSLADSDWLHGSAGT